MAFPQSLLPLKVELYLNGWVDVTSYVRREGGNGITIRRGRANEAGQVEVTQASLVLVNTDGRFSERNATGPYYGLLSRNTPCRVSITRDTKVLEMGGGQHDLIACPDAAALDITGDIDIRVDAHLHDWWTPTHLACKWRSVTGDQRSWALVVEDGFLRLWWSTAGTSGTRTSVRSTTTLPVTTGRLAVRVTLDVNNGASGNTATFYTSTSISGSWTQLGDAVVTSGTTSIYSGTASLEAGGFTEASFSTLNSADLYGYTSVHGWLYAFQLRNGIGGTVVANPDFTIQDVGDPSFADTASSPNTWSVNSGANVTDRWWRFHGEVSAWPQAWDLTGRDVTVRVTAAGPLRRLAQGATPLRSVQYQSAVAEDDVLAYWPCEDGTGSTSIASGLPDGLPLQYSGSLTFASYDGFPGAENVLVADTAKFLGEIRAAPAATEVQLQFLIHIPDAGITDGYQDLVSLVTSTFRFELEYDSPGSGGRFLLQGKPVGGSAPTTDAVTDVNGADLCVTITAVQDGADVDYSLTVYTLATGASVTKSATETSGTLGQVQYVTIGGASSLLTPTGVALGHIIVRTSQADTAEVASLLQGRAGEPAGTRFARLCTEAGITYRAIGDLASTELMGPQRPGTLVELLKECATTDLGMLFEPLDCLGLGYRTHRSLENQTAALLLNYADHELAEPPLPTGDDENVRNDYTVQRVGGTTSRQELTTGRMSTAAPPDGVGRYAVQEAVSLYTDAQVPTHASIRLWFGSVDEERYPNIKVNRTTPAVVANAAVNNSLLALNVGHVLAIDDLPEPQLPPGQVRQIIQGWSETLANFEHHFTYNTTPASPWDFGVAGSTTLGRIDTDGSELAAAVTSSATSMVVATTSGAYWTEAVAEFPLDVKIAGEQVTVTDIDPAVSDTFTRSTSNGWGSATSGQAWTRSFGDAADFAVNGSAGVIDVDTVGAERWVTLAQTSTSWDVQFRCRTLVTAATQPINTYIGLMMTGTSAGYIARMAFYNDQTIRLSIEEIPFALLASEVTVAGLTHAANTWYRLRFQCIEGSLRARAWADSGVEPAGWHVYATDTTYTSGGMGVRAVLTSGNTNTLPVVVQYDDIRSNTPQTFTVTRAVNGVSKAQAAGADVRLNQPMILAL